MRLNFKYLVPAVFAAPAISIVASAVWNLADNKSCSRHASLCAATAGADLSKTLTMMYVGIIGLVMSLAIGAYVSTRTTKAAALFVAFMLVIGGSAHIALCFLALMGEMPDLHKSDGPIWGLIALDLGMFVMGFRYMYRHGDIDEKR